MIEELNQIKLKVCIKGKGKNGLEDLITLECDNPSIGTRSMSRLHIQNLYLNHHLMLLIVILNQTPARIDYEPDLNNLWLLSDADVDLFPEPYSVMQKGAHTLYLRPDLKRKESEEHVRA